MTLTQLAIGGPIFMFIAVGAFCACEIWLIERAKKNDVALDSGKKKG